MGQFGVGQAVTRVEDRRLLTGAGRYSDDVSLPGQVHAVFLRSPHAHARIGAVDIEAAKAAPGVLAIFTIDDVKAAGLGGIKSLYPLKQKDGSPLFAPDRPLLADGVARHVGDPVAMVVAETPAQARDAAELVDVDYDARPACVDMDAATAPDAPKVWDDAPDNRSFLWSVGEEAETAAALQRAERVLRLKLVNNRVVVNSIEPRVALGAHEDGRFTLHTPSQGPHSIRRQLARDIFHLDEDDFHLITGDVGGAFGMKIFLYPEQPMVLFAAKRLGRPVKWTGERSADAFQADIQGRDHISEIELGVDAEDRIAALRIHTKANLGSYVSNFGALIPTNAGCRMLSGVYAIPTIYVEVEGLFTHTVPVDAYRGAGRPEATYLIERLMDAAAHDLGLDPIDFRRRNYIEASAMPFTTALGVTYDSGDFAAMTERAMALADRDGFEARRAEAAARGKLRGFGFAYYIESCGAGSGETAKLAVDETGAVTLYIGTQSNGQGHETAYAQIIADKLGIPIDRVRVIQGDTDLVKTGNGTGGSRSLPQGGPSVERGTDDLIANARKIAAQVLEAGEGDIDLADGVFSVVGTDRRKSLGDLARAARDPAINPAGADAGLGGEATFKADHNTYPNGAHVCEVEIDPDTGTVDIKRYIVCDDFGTVVNPLLLAGQVHGGIAQGLGQALMEHTVYDADGQLLSGSFMDYTLPRADTVPGFEFHYYDDIPCATNPMGIKGAGEAGAIGAPPASINAIVDALAPYGIRHVDMPATAASIWRAIQSAPARAAE